MHLEFTIAPMTFIKAVSDLWIKITPVIDED